MRGSRSPDLSLGLEEVRYAAPGTYSGSIKVTAADFDATVPIQLVVLNATLPSTSSLSSAFGMGFQAACLARYGDAEFCPTPDDGYRLNALLITRGSQPETGCL
jgi:hypothetical protein